MRLSLLRLVQIEQGRAAEIADCPRSPSEATTAGWEFPLASFINLHTDARLIECRLATAVSDIPERRSLTTCSRLISSRARPIWRPSSRALLMPDLTRSTTSDRSSSAIAEMMVMNKRPIASPVATPSLRLMNSMPILSNDLQEIPCASRNAVERRYQHYGELLSPGVSHERIEPRTPCLLSTNTTIFVLVDNLVALLRRQLAEIVELTFDVLVGRAHSDIERNFFHRICSSTYNKADLIPTGDG